MWFSIIANLLIATLFLVAAVFLFRLRRAPVAAIFAAAFLLTAMTHRSDLWHLAGLSNLSDILNTVGWSGMIAGMLIFPDGRFPSRLSLAVAAFCGATMPITTINMLGQNVTNLLFVAQFVLAAAVLAMRYRGLPPGSERQQMRWAFFGFAIAVVLLAFAVMSITIYSSAAGADIWSHAWLPVIGQTLLVLAVASIIGGLLVSVLRFRLYDADTVIGRSAALGVLTLGFVALFAGSEKLVEIIGERYFADSVGMAAGAIGAAIAAVMIVPLHNRVHGWAERRFQKALIRMRHGLPQCVDDLRESGSVEQLATAVTSPVEAGVRSTRSAILVRDGAHWSVVGTRGVQAKAVQNWQNVWPMAEEGQEIESRGPDELFPTRVPLRIDSGEAPETVGWLLLGPRPDGSFYGKDEREALAEIAEPVARALHIASIRQQRERAAEARLDGIEQVLAKLVDRLSSPGSGIAMA